MVVMLVPYLLNGMGSFSQNVSAETTESRDLLDNEKVKIEATGQVDQENQHWKIYYEKKEGEGTQESRLKFKVNEIEQFSSDAFLLEEDWLIEKEFSTSAKGTIEVTVPKETPAIELEIQLDEQDEAGTLLKDQFNEAEAGPYELKLEQSTDSAVNESSQTEGSTTIDTAGTLEKQTSTTKETTEETEHSAELTGEVDQGTEATSSIGSFSLYSGSARNVTFEAAVDPFQYYGSNNPTGIYPKHDTNQYLPSSETSENIKNYNYGSSDKKVDAKDDVEMFNITGSELNFANGYHEYGSTETGQLNTKKTVSPTDDPNIFQVQLDTIGDAIRPIPKVDIVLVLDKSSSMVANSDADGVTRWAQLQEAVKKFSADMLSNPAYDIQIGMAAFGSDWRSSTDSDPYGEIASFEDFTLPSSGLPTSLTGFTKDASAIEDHYMLTDAPSSSGTPTFLGVDAGLKLLTTTGYGARTDAEKVLITITDGDPTYRATDSYTAGNNITNSLNRLGKTKMASNSGVRMTAGTRYFDGTGTSSSIDDCRQPTVTFIANRYAQYSNQNYYGVGFHTDESANEVVSALGPNGTFKATDVESLIKALSSAIAEFISTIYNATIKDPMSEFVKLVEGSYTTSALSLSTGDDATLVEIQANDSSYPQYAKDIVVNEATDTEGDKGGFTLNHVNLGLDTNGNRQGYRLTYQVELKEEYRDGTFYPANGTTYLANGDGSNKYYAVPSVRAPLPKVDFELTKVVAGTSIGLAGAKFQLFDSKEGGNEKSAEVESNSSGGLKFTDITPGTYWLRETVTPEGFETMQPIQITVDRNGNVTGEGITDGKKIGNTLKQINLTINKKGQENQPLTGADFELRQGQDTFPLTEGTNGVYTLSELDPGEYQVWETTAPEGYETLGEIGTLTITNKGEIYFTPVGANEVAYSVKKDGEQIQIIMDVPNALKPFELNVLKQNAHDEKLVLEGAVFTLYDKDPSDTTAVELATATTGEDGTAQFVAGGKAYQLEAGKTYYFKETTAPDGYVLSNSIYKVVVGTDGTAKVYENETELTGSTVELKSDSNNQIGLTIKNEPKAPLPKTGGIGRMPWLITGLILALVTTVYLFRSRYSKEVL